jgi:hypothetical protein
LTPSRRLAKRWGLDKHHSVLLAKLRFADRLDFPRVIVESSTVRAVRERINEPNPADRGTADGKHRIVVHAAGTPLNVILTSAKRHDSIQLMPLLGGLYKHPVSLASLQIWTDEQLR